MDSKTKQMIQKAKMVLKNSYTPYSDFGVASCICTEDGHFFTGVNVENAAYGLSLCAEASAICHMVNAGYQHIQSIVILAENNKLCPPCGACRQRLFEFSNPTTRIYLCDNEKVLQALTIAELIPFPFNL